jgi:hypothetical protein
MIVPCDLTKSEHDLHLAWSFQALKLKADLSRDKIECDAAGAAWFW